MASGRTRVCIRLVTRGHDELARRLRYQPRVPHAVPPAALRLLGSGKWPHADGDSIETIRTVRHVDDRELKSKSLSQPSHERRHHKVALPSATPTKCMLPGDEVHHPVRETLTKELKHGENALLLMPYVHRWPRLPNNRHAGDCTNVDSVAVAKRRLGLNQDWVTAVTRRLMAGFGCACIAECPNHASIIMV